MSSLSYESTSYHFSSPKLSIRAQSFKADCSGAVEICCLSEDAGFICAPRRTENHSRDRGSCDGRRGAGSGNRNAHEALTVSGKWVCVVAPASSRCQGCEIPNYGCKFCTTASCLITPDRSSHSPFFTLLQFLPLLI